MAKTKGTPGVFYMHTINGKPASYSGTHAPFIGVGGVIDLVESLHVIRRQQGLAAKQRGVDFPNSLDNTRYDYVRVRVPSGGSR